MTTPDTSPTTRADTASYEEQSEDEMVAEVVAARKAGTLRRGGLRIHRTPTAELEQQLAEAPTDQELEQTIPVTIRMPASMVAALKEEAQRQGVRGYQTLMKRWIAERLAGEQLVSTRDVAEALGQLHNAESALEKLLG
ncbi:MAG: hypothetical protein KGJ86_08350 [Chloroflexota bacterium]|nr:hypothetical protein [Chloroflexota bacterium]